MSTSLSEIASKTGLSEDAIRTLHEALVHSRGAAAQFDHPELGGMGQWMRGGMVMIGDMSNAALAAKVSLACTLLSEHAEVQKSAAPQATWWPKDFGDPSQSASQNALDYAYFPALKRLAVRESGTVAVYDLSELAFHGVGAQDGAIVIHTDSGSRRLEELRKL